MGLVSHKRRLQHWRRGEGVRGCVCECVCVCEDEGVCVCVCVHCNYVHIVCELYSRLSALLAQVAK